MEIWIIIGWPVIGILIAGLIARLVCDNKNEVTDNMAIWIVMATCWPVLLGLGLISLPFVGAGYAVYLIATVGKNG